MKTIISVLGISAALVLWAPRAAAQEATTPTIDQSLELKSVSNPRISPDGRWVVYEVQRTNWEENAFERDLWIVATATGESYQLTRSRKSSTNASWSPHGKWIAFLSDRPSSGSGDDKRQLYLISPAGGEARQLTKVEAGVTAFEWSPDGRYIAYAAPDPESKERKDRKEKYGEIEIVQGDYTMTHLWVIEVPADDSSTMPEPDRLTEGRQFTVLGFSWSPEGGRIAFSAARNPDLSFRDTSDIYVLKLADESVKKIVDTKGPDANPAWSPDGKQIAYVTANGNECYYYTNDQIAVVPADGGTPDVLTLAFDEDANLLAWAPEGIYFSALQRTYAHLFRLHATTKAVERISAPDKLLAAQFSFTRNYRHVAFLAAEDNQFLEAYFSALQPFVPKRLTAMGDQLKNFRLARRELVEWKSTDGVPMEGVLLKPAEFDPSRKYPLLVVLHGGPTGVDRTVVFADRYYPLERFVARGALILMPNYRGSAGYGEKFRSLNVRNLGIGDSWDVISGVDHLIAKGWVDRDRVGAMGWSQGGYISAFLTTTSERFRAVSVGAGISDWMTYYVNTDIHPFTRQYLKATPWDDPEIYRKTSPISHVKSAKTPTLIQHGSNDARVPIPNAYELHQALQDCGVPVKMVVYKGFGHPINKPKQQRAVMEENYNWFARWIWGETPAGGRP